MFWLFSSVLLAVLTQLAPELTPQKAPKPALPKIHENACPFEGCRFGPWRAIGPVQVFDTWKTDRKLLRSLRKGEIVTAITGIDITFEPGEIVITAPIPDYGLKPGDIVYTYMYLGEGICNAWFKGYWVEDFDTSGMEAPNGDGCRRNCNAKLLKQSRGEWWIEIRTKNGTIGWTKDGDKFAGTDALAAP